MLETSDLGLLVLHELVELLFEYVLLGISQFDLGAEKLPELVLLSHSVFEKASLLTLCLLYLVESQ